LSPAKELSWGAGRRARHTVARSVIRYRAADEVNAVKVPVGHAVEVPVGHAVIGCRGAGP
jgi:hypothetical protein